MANRNLVITTPRGTVFTTTSKSGTTKAVLEWNADFGSKMTGNFSRAQKFVDSEVLRFCSARVPVDTHMLRLSGVLGTVVGSGEVQYIAPYSAYQYYKTAPSRVYDGRRGGMWFERGKATERARILAGARQIAGGGR